ncbi:hypothetical protein H1Z61_02185 [Bacillus aquiflavi]|uniref:Pyruvate kinase n=1 Tax=Bacillus aquiflavi TaxID=2672567 RepID=A0A6B3VPW3_9BACI|nr:pyruvate kinase [Bacillus aquiflavi]MBA4535975.1 hypothetical protein [Bacillus aquiflavi]NEY80350.1 hypothetical protein [Bacillus aquiflavi]
MESREKLMKTINQIIHYVQAKINHSDVTIGKSPLSSENLMAFLALRSLKLFEVDKALREEGLISISDITPHVLYSLEKIKLNLGIDNINSFKQLVNPEYAHKTIESRTKKLFGSTQMSIMVTLDKDMLGNKALFKELLLAGMNIARINCAHDHPEIWEQLIKAIRLAEHDLKLKEPCKIYMDLAGPKVRVEKLTTANEQIKLTAEQENSCTNTKIGMLALDTNESIITENSFRLAVTGNNDFSLVTIGDQLTFIDAKSKKRKFTIIEILDSTKVKVKLNKQAIIHHNMSISTGELEWKVDLSKTEVEEIIVRKGDIIRIYRTKNARAAKRSMTITESKALINVKINDRIFINDGKICGVVCNVTSDFIDWKVVTIEKKMTKIKKRKGINLPDSFLHFNLPALTTTDIFHLPFICKHADLIGLSFVHHPEDIRKLISHINSVTTKTPGIIAKIETKEAIYHLSKIICEGLQYKAFGVMVARGDLAVEIGFELLSSIQENILSICEAAHVPVIWATGVLNHLTKTGIPSRTEMSDISLGMQAQCIMLNKGPFIVDSVQMLKRIFVKRDDRSHSRYDRFDRFITQYVF